MNMLNEYKKNGIYVKHAIDDVPQDAAFPMHVHRSYEIYLFIKGKVNYLVEGSSYALYPGCILVIRPSESHKPKILEATPYERFNINFPASLVERFDPELRLLAPFTERSLGQDNVYTSSELGDHHIRRLFEEMCDSERDAYGRELKITTNLICLLGALCDAYEARGTTDLPPSSREKEMVAYVNDHLKQRLTTPALAAHFYLSPSQFCRIFKGATGASPGEYITAKRLSYARELLRSGAGALEAFEESGYGDYSTFYRAYVKYYGNTPTEEKKHGK